MIREVRGVRRISTVEYLYAVRYLIAITVCQ